MYCRQLKQLKEAASLKESPSNVQLQAIPSGNLFTF